MWRAMPEGLAIERQQDRTLGGHAEPRLQILKEAQRLPGKTGGTIKRRKFVPPARRRATIFRLRQRTFCNRPNCIHIESAFAISVLSR
jgi:hypothetical protein